MNKLIANDGREMIMDLPASPRSNSDGSYDIKCPFCPPRKPKHENQKKLNINPSKYSNVTVFRCNHCGTNGIVADENYLNKNKIEELGPVPVVINIDQSIIKWFKKVRHISEETLLKLNIYSTYESVRQLNSDKKNEIGGFVSRLCIAYPYIRNGRLINTKFRDKHKNFKLISGASKVPYNIDSIKGYSYCVWVEGENDVLAYTESGIIPVISPPNGSTITKAEKEEYDKTGKISKLGNINMDWLDAVYHDFSKIEKHYIATDNDGPGYKMREAIASRFGKEKCYTVNFSDYKYKEKEEDVSFKVSKDPNEILIRFSKEDLFKTIEKATAFPVDNIITIKDVVEDLVYQFKHGKEKGITTGYKTIDPYFTWKPGQTTILNGYPGEGKTTFTLNLIILSIMMYGFKWLIYSPENYPPSNIIDTMAEIIVGSSSDRDVKTRMSLSQYIAAIKKVLADQVFFADREEGFTPEQFREKSIEMVRKHGVNAILIDPWRGLNHNHKGRNLDEYLEYQLGMENRFVTTHNVIRLINHHPPTPDKKEANVQAPSPYNLKGGEIWYARSYNILCIHREDKFSFDNLKAQFWSQKIKENKLVGIVTPKERPVILNFERKSQRLLEYVSEKGKSRLKWPGEDINLFDQYSMF